MFIQVHSCDDEIIQANAIPYYSMATSRDESLDFASIKKIHWRLDGNEEALAAYC